MKKKIFIFLSLIVLTGCSKTKTVFVCGDHLCVNKAEAEQYFEDNLSLEVKIIDKKKKSDIDLVELNLKKTEDGKKEISIFKKKNTNNKVKELTKFEKSKKKAEIKKKRKNKKEKLNNTKDENKKIVKKENTQNKDQQILNVCTILKECTIEQISKYLINEGKGKKFPDITIRE